MKIIGRGWQYSVYDLGNGRVLKKYNTYFQAYFVMLRDCFPYIRNPIWKLSDYYKGCRQTALDSINKIRKTNLDMVLFGNPKILNELDYEQDKVISLRDYFKTVNFDEGRKIIDEFIRLNLTLIKNRLIDKSFNIGKNFAIDSRKNIILVDIGELYSSEEGIKKQIRIKAWQAPYVTSALPKKFREYFVVEMNKKITDDFLLFDSK